MGKEFELKYKASPEILEKIRQEYGGGFETLSMASRYYDTPDRALSARWWTLRLRQENGTAVCGLKTPGKNMVRGEWEVREPDLDLGLAKLCAMDVPEEFPDLVKNGVEEVCAADFTRLAKALTWGGSLLELALDEGDFLGRHTRRHFAEVEVELKSGSRRDCEAFGAALVEKYGLETETVSKFQRAFALAEED